MANLTDSRTTINVNLPHFSGTKPQCSVRALASGNLSSSASRSNQLGTLTRLKLNTMDQGANRDITQRQCVTSLDRSFRTRLNYIALLNTLGSNNVTTLTIRIKNQRQMSTAIRIVLNTLYTADKAILITLKIDSTITALMTTTNMASGDATLVVPPT
jgi:hypothetical protein